MLTTTQKAEITKDIKRHDTDTGSPEYQIAIFTVRIKKLTAHLKNNKHDFHSRRGLLKLVAKRKRALDYLYKNDLDAYKKVTSKLELKSK